MSVDTLKEAYWRGFHDGLGRAKFLIKQADNIIVQDIQAAKNNFPYDTMKYEPKDEWRS